MSCQHVIIWEITKSRAAIISSFISMLFFCDQKGISMHQCLYCISFSFLFLRSCKYHHQTRIEWLCMQHILLLAPYFCSVCIFTFSHPQTYVFSASSHILFTMLETSCHLAAWSLMYWVCAWFFCFVFPQLFITNKFCSNGFDFYVNHYCTANLHCLLHWIHLTLSLRITAFNIKENIYHL